MSAQSTVSGRKVQRTARLAKLINSEPDNYLGNIRAANIRYYGGPPRQDDQHIPSQYKRGNRRCRACHVLSVGHHAVFLYSRFDLLVGSPPDCDRTKISDEDEREFQRLAHSSDLRSRTVSTISPPRDLQKVDCQTCTMLLEGFCDLFDPTKTLEEALEVSVNPEEGFLINVAGSRIEYYLLHGKLRLSYLNFRLFRAFQFKENPVRKRSNLYIPIFAEYVTP